VSANLVSFPGKPDCADLVKALRNIADDIEAGAYDFDPQFAVLVLGVETQRRDLDGFSIYHRWQTHGLGESATPFRVRGLLSSAIQRFDGDCE
jgi:hypothetical protein